MIKRNKLKIIIATLIATITTCIFLIFTNSTFAYQSDRLSYTLTYNQTINDVNFYNINTPLQTTDDKSNYVLMINYTYNSQANNNVYISWQWANGTTTITALSNTNNNRNVNNNGITTLIHKFGYFNTSNIISSIGIKYQNGYTINDVVNIDLVKLDEIWIGDYVEVYVNNYTSQLEQDIESLRNNYETLEDNYEELETNYNTLNNNYETLENNYEELETNYNNKSEEYNKITNGAMGYLDYTSFYINNTIVEFNNNDTELDLNELISNNLYENSNLYLEYFTTTTINPNYEPLKIYFHFNKLPITLFSMYFNGLSRGTMQIWYDLENNSYSKLVNIDNSNTTGQSLINYSTFNGIKLDYIEDVTIEYNNADNISYSISFNTNYNTAYQNGYNTGLNYGKNIGYNNGYTTGKEEGITQANSQINEDSASYVAGYRSGANSNNNLGGMILTIMESPINMFKQMFNFDILGFNISSFLFSLVSLLLIAFIIKKLIK